MSLPNLNIRMLGEIIPMTTPRVNQDQLYRNAIEPLVAEEAMRQLQQLPPKMLASLNREQILAQAIAYALNRLPALYATSDRGWQFQQQQAREKLAKQIVVAVRQGLAAVQRDPLTPVWNLESLTPPPEDAPPPEIDKFRALRAEVERAARTRRSH